MTRSPREVLDDHLHTSVEGTVENDIERNYASQGRRSPGRVLAASGLGVVSLSGWLGGDITFRHGVGMRPQALRDPNRTVSATSAAPLDTAAARHLNYRPMPPALPRHSRYTWVAVPVPRYWDGSAEAP